MEKNISTAAEQTKTAEVKKNPKIIELAHPYKFDDKEYTEIDLSGLDGLTIKDAVLIIKKLYNEGELAAMITPETATHTPTLWPQQQRSSPLSSSSCFPSAQAKRYARPYRHPSAARRQRTATTRTIIATS